MLSAKLKPAIGRPCVLALVDSGTVPAFTCDCLRVAGVFMLQRYFDLCVSASSRTMLGFGNNVSCSSSTCSTLGSNLRLHGREYAGVQVLLVDRKR